VDCYWTDGIGRVQPAAPVRRRDVADIDHRRAAVAAFPNAS
jgi:hypothetical protein